MDKELTHRLMFQALNSMTVPTQYEFCERFAGLIAEECAKIVDADCDYGTPGVRLIAAAIRWKFVE